MGKRIHYRKIYQPVKLELSLVWFSFIYFHFVKYQLMSVEFSIFWIQNISLRLTTWYFSNHGMSSSNSCLNFQRVKSSYCLSVFTCSKMRHLTLQYCVVNPPPTFQAFSKLLRLQLFNIAISEKSLENFIYRCQMLKDMDLDITDPLNFPNHA